VVIAGHDSHRPVQLVGGLPQRLVLRPDNLARIACL
jgi:hypothetical protein